MNRTQRICDYCKKEFSNRHKRKYCSKQCSDNGKIGKTAWNKGLKGTHFSSKTEFKNGQVPWNKEKKGIHLSPKTEFKKGLTPWNKGRMYSPELRKKLSEVHKGLQAGQKHPMYGKHHSDKTKQKISEANKGKPSPNKGKPMPEELKKRLIALNKGRIPKNKGKTNIETYGKEKAEEMKRKLSEANKGKPSPMKGKKTGKVSWMKGKTFTPEQLEKLRKSHLGQKAYNKGKTYEEMFGKEKSEELKRKSSEFHKSHPSRYWLGKTRPDLVEPSRKRLLRLYASGAFPKQSNTLPERLVKEELLKRGYKERQDFFHQYPLGGRFVIDFAFPKQKIFIEVQGDYWHGSFRGKAWMQFNDTQLKNIQRFIAKREYMTKYDNGTWKLIELWESDIKKDIKSCVDKIEEAMR